MRTASSGNQAFRFLASRACSGAAGELRYAAGQLQGNLNGDGWADFLLRFTGTPALPGSDIRL